MQIEFHAVDLKLKPRSMIQLLYVRVAEDLHQLKGVEIQPLQPEEHTAYLAGLTRPDLCLVGIGFVDKAKATRRHFGWIKTIFEI